MRPDDIDPVALAALLGTLAPAHPLALAARAGLEVGALRAGTDRDNYIGGRWHRQHPMTEYSVLQMLRYPPTGCRDMWILYGPDGPPGWVAASESAERWAA